MAALMPVHFFENMPALAVNFDACPVLPVSAKWAEGPALDGRRGLSVAFRLSAWLAITGRLLELC